MLRRFILAIGLAAGPALAASSDPLPPTREGALLNAFQVICDRDTPNFDGIEAQANAMRMRLQDGSASPAEEGTTTRHRAWIGALTTGPFGLFLDEMSGPNGVATGCAVFGQVSDADAFRAEAVRSMHLPDVPPPAFEPDGSRSFTWANAPGPGATLVVRDLSPTGKPGVMVKRLWMVPHP